MNPIYPNQPVYPNAFMNQGVVPNQQPMPKTGNWLTADKYAMLQKGLGQFNLSVTSEELARGQCNHYKADGTSALIPDQDGSGGCTCSVCGTHFTSTEYSGEDVKTATQYILDILNTIKIMYLSIDPAAALEYFQIIPFIEKIPQLYNIAVADFKKYEGVSNYVPAQQGGNPFNFYNMMTYGPVVPPVYPQPGVPNQMAQPMNNFAQQNPSFNPIYGAPVAPAVGYQPQATGYAFNPQGAAAVNTNMPVQPQTAAPAADETVKVDTQFKK